VIVTLIVATRLVVPLFIPRFPLVIIVALIVDAVDQTVLAQWTEVDTGEDGPYQSYDKALDIYYLTVAYLAAMRNWASEGAFRVARFLFLYRLVGVTLFELTDERWVLFVFPNTFEYFFIAYEVVRLRWDPTRISTRGWVLTAAAIWVFVKLPQEWWIHIAQLDFTDAVREHTELFVLLGFLALILAVGAWLVLRLRVPAPDWAFRLAADPIAPELATPEARYSSRLARGIRSRQLLEEAFLLSLVCLIFAIMLPGGEASPLEVCIVVSAIVLANTLTSLWVARRGGLGIRSAAVLYLLRFGLNFALLYLAGQIAGEREPAPLGHALFFAQLITLITWLYDWYRPLYEARFRQTSSAPEFSAGSRRADEEISVGASLHPDVR
jgi:hypothetical protein